MNTSDSGLADPQLTIADLRRELALAEHRLSDAERRAGECTAERDEALARETATAEVLGVINSSPGDLAPVFDAMLERAMRLCEAQLGFFLSHTGGKYAFAAGRGLKPELAEYLSRMDQPGPNEANTQVIEGAPFVHIVDLKDDEPYRLGAPLRRACVDLGGARTGLGVPMRKGGVLLGTLSLARYEVRPFSDEQIALVQNFAAQAVIATENARLIIETREALEQQTATAEVLQVINSSPGDLTPVFDAMLERAVRLCEAAHGYLYTYDNERFAPVAMRGDATFADWLRQQAPIVGLGTSPHGRIARGERFVHIADVLQDDAYRNQVGYFHEACNRAGTRTFLAVSLRKDDALLGTIHVYRREVRPFSEKQIALLQNFAAQAVIAMENARLITQTQEALDQQTATAEVLGVINSSPGDLKPVFDAMLDKARSLCGAVHGALVVYDGEHFRAVATHGLPERIEGLLRTPFRPNPVHQALLQGERLIHIADQAAVTTNTEIGRASVDAGARTLLLVPLRKDDALLGYITASRWEVRPFSDKEIALLENFAAQAVIAIENARLITETREALEQQTATAEVLQVINSSPGDLAPVFEAILEKARTLCGAAHGSLSVYDGELFHAVATHGVSETFASVLRRPRPASRVHELLQAGERFVHIADMKTLTVAPSDIVTPAAVEAGIRTQLFVPLRKDGILLGYITAHRREVRPFSEKEIALLENFAAQAVIAIENARLLDELRQRTEEVAQLNRGLEARVAEQVEELGRVGRLKRFLAPQLAEMIVSHGDEKILESHRREIVVVFCDLRGYTAFTETAEPEEVLDFLREYHGALGPLVSQFEGTLDQFSGDGIMVFFNDPVPIPDPAERAVNMAVAMREAAGSLTVAWRERGRELGFGAGIAQGYATLGQIGFSERSGYTAIGTVCNVAARLCAEAGDGQILLSQRVNVALKGSVPTEQMGALALKGLTQPVIAYNVPTTSSQPALRVIEGGPPSD